MACRYIEADSNMREILFGESWDLHPTTRWLNAVVGALLDLTSDKLFSWSAKGTNFNVSTTGDKKLVAFVRYSHETGQACIGVERGGKKGYDSDILAAVVQQAHTALLDDVRKLRAARQRHAIPPPPARPTPRCMTALADFSRDAYGSADEYLSFKKGDVVWLTRAPLDVPSCGWAYG